MKARIYFLLLLLFKGILIATDSQAQTPSTVCIIKDNEIGLTNNKSKYFFPITLSEQEVDTLVKLLSIHQILTAEQQSLLQNQKAEQAEKAELEDVKAQFQLEVDRVIAKIQQIEQMILKAEKSKTQISPQDLQEAKDRIANARLLTHSTQCMANKLDIQVTADSSGHKAFGFLREALFQNPHFFHLGAFHNGIAVVKNNDNLYGYIDLAGQMVIEPQYSFASSFSNGKAIVKKLQTWYLLNSEFELKPIGSGQLEQVKGVVETCPGFFITQIDEKYYILNSTLPNPELSEPYDSILYHSEEKVFWCKAPKEEILYRISQDQTLHPIIRSITILFDIGLPHHIKYLEDDALSWRIMDMSNPEQPVKASNSFYDISPFYHQTFAVANPSVLLGAGTIMLIDGKGKIITSFKKTYSVDVLEELLNDKYIVIGVDQSGQQNLVHHFYEKGSCRQINKTAVYRFPKSGFNQHGHLQVADQHDKWGVIDTAGRQILPYLSDRSLAYSNATYLVTQGGKMGAYDVEGTQLTEIKYDGLSGYYNGFYVFQLGNKKGVVNHKSEELIPPIFAKIKVYKKFFECGLVSPMVQAKTYRINRKGKCISGDCDAYRQLLAEYDQKN